MLFCAFYSLFSICNFPFSISRDVSFLFSIYVFLGSICFLLPICSDVPSILCFLIVFYSLCAVSCSFHSLFYSRAPISWRVRVPPSHARVQDDLSASLRGFLLAFSFRGLMCNGFLFPYTAPSVCLGFIGGKAGDKKRDAPLASSSTSHVNKHNGLQFFFLFSFYIFFLLFLFV